jgi:hypothetical protein
MAFIELVGGKNDLRKQFDRLAESYRKGGEVKSTQSK